MTIERFYETLSYIIALDKKLRLQASLDAIKTSLISLVQSPAQPIQQQALATALQAFDDASSSLANELSTSDYEAIGEVGGGDYFKPELAAQIRASISSNAMTPSVPSAFVQNLASNREHFLEVVNSTIVGLDALGVSAPMMPIGSADLAFVIPRELFRSKLDLFAKELIFFNRLVAHVSEALTGTPEAAVLETLSSSTPTVVIKAGLDVLSALATAVNGFLDAWKKVEDFRATRTKLIELGLSGTAIDEVNQRIEQIVEEVVETTTTTILTTYPGDSTRRNELSNALKKETHRLFGQIEQGLLVQFRAETEDPRTPSTSQDLLTNIDNVGRHLVFPKPGSSPLLLSAGEVIDSDIVLHTTTTTTKKTTTKTAGKKAGNAGTA